MNVRRSGAMVFVVAVVVAAVALWRHTQARHATGDAKQQGPSASESGRSPRTGANPAGRRVAGSVRSDGGDVSAVTVRVTTVTGPADLRRVEPDASGQFDLGVLPVARYLVIAEKPHVTGAFAWIDLHDPTADSEHLTLVLHTCIASVHGTVRDASGGPVVGARVAHTEDGLTPAAGAQTDASGNYELCTVPGASSLIVTADGYAEVTAHITASGRVRRDFLLAPEATVAGRVVRASDQSPVAAAVVTLLPEADSASFIILHATTDDDGRFRFSGASVGRQMLVASADGLASQRQTPVLAEVGKVQEDLIVEVVPAGQVRGTVVEGGKGVPGARVALAGESSVPYWLGLSAVTRADGSFVIEHVLPGEYTPSVDSFAPVAGRATPVAVPAAGLDGLTLDVERLASISGRITRNGKPVDGAQVRTSRGYAISDGNGQYVMRGLPAGTYRVYAESKQVGAFTNGPSVTVAKGEQRAGVDVDLDLSASIAGTVLDQDGVPVSGVVVSFSLLRGRDFGTATTSEDGTFLATALSGGGAYTYQVRSSSSAQWTYDLLDGKRPAPIAVQDGQSQVKGVVIRIRREQLSISGHVVNAKGEPLPDIIVRLGIGYVFGGGYESSTTDVAGAFTIRDLPKGSYTVRATTARGDVSIEGIAAGRTDVVIRIPDAAGIDGTLEGFGVQPEVYAVRKDDEPGVYQASIHGASFTIDGIPPGAYEVHARCADGFDSARLNVAEGAHTRITLHRQAYGSIAGRVVDADTHEPLVGLRCVGGAEPTTTDSAGRFRLDRVAAGPDVPVYCGRRDAQTSGTVTVTSGQTAELELVAHVEDTRPHSYAGLALEGQFGDALVKSVDAGGPADLAGLQVGDVLVEIDGTAWQMLGGRPVAELERRAPGTIVKITVERSDKKQTFSLTLAPPR